MPKPPDPDRPQRILRGVWLPASLATADIPRLAAILAALPDGTVLSGPTAARLHGMWLPRQSKEHVTIPAGPRGARHTTAPRRPELVAHRHALGPDDIEVRCGLPVTSAARTWSDLASLLPVPDLVAAGDAVLHLGLADPGQLQLAAQRWTRRPGAVHIRLAAGMLDSRSRSRPESHLRVALIRAGLPWPAVNEPASDENGGWLAEPDLSYGMAKVAIEYQGADHADPRQMRRDVARHMDLRRAGWEVLYYTAEQIFSHPEQAVADVCQVLAVRAPQLLANVRGRRRDGSLPAVATPRPNSHLAPNQPPAPETRPATGSRLPVQVRGQPV